MMSDRGYRRYWRVALALGWLVLAGAAPPPTVSPSAQTEQQKQEAAASAAPYVAYPDRYADSCYRAKDHDAADLCAQWRAAVAAEKAADASLDAISLTRWSNEIALVGALLNFFSVVLIVCTLFLTRQANKTSRDMFEVDSRPFLTIRSCSNGIKFKDGRLLPDPVEFEIENSGRGPAIVTGIYREWRMCGYGKFPEPIKSGEQRLGWKYKETSIPIGPGSRSGSIESFNRHLKAEGHEPNSWISFIGYIHYKDVGGAEYVMGFLHIFRLDMPSRGLHLALPEHAPDSYNYYQRKPAPNHAPSGAGRTDQSQKMTAAAKAMIEKKAVGHQS